MGALVPFFFLFFLVFGLRDAPARLVRELEQS